MAKYRAFKDSWSVNSFVKRFKNGEINFDNPIQRGVVWDKKDSSLYIHSLLFDILVYQKPFLISKKDNGWDVLDGKQRGTTLINYVNNKFELTGLEEEPLITVKGEEVDINKRLFKHLPDDLQMKILDFQIEIAMLEDAPIEIESLFFRRSNSGRGMTNVDMARSSNISIEDVKILGHHELFSYMFSEKMLQRFSQDEIVVKTWQVLNEENPDFSIAHFKQVMKMLVLTEEDKERINSVYDFMLETYKYVEFSDVNIAKMILKKTHFLGCIAFIEKFSSPQHFSQWIIQFFSNMPEEYIGAASQQTAGVKNTQIRYRILKDSVESFLQE